MARPIVAVSSVVVGCVAFVVVARLTLRDVTPPAGARSAPTVLLPRAAPVHTPRGTASADALQRPELPPQRPELPPQRPELPSQRPELPSQRITVWRPYRRHAAAPPWRSRAKAPARGWPCSPWRALGPVHSVHQGEKPRQRHVRSLCFDPRPLAAAGGPSREARLER